MRLDAFILQVSKVRAKPVIVHLRDLDLHEQKFIHWSTISVPPLVKSCDLCIAGFDLTSSLVVPKISCIVDSKGTFLFPELFVITTYEFKTNLFVQSQKIDIFQYSPI